MRSPTSGKNLTPAALNREAADLVRAAGFEVPYRDASAFGVAKDFLLERGYDQFTASSAVNEVMLSHPTAPPPRPQDGRCDICGRSGAPWRDGAGRYLCDRHQDDY